MSLEDARSFIAKVKADPTFAKSISKYPPEERKNALIKAGFNFTDEELKQAREELSDDELAAVAAGGWNADSDGRSGTNVACDAVSVYF